MTELALVGIDMGTGGARVGIFDPHGKLLGTHAVLWDTQYPRAGRAEQDPDEWWRCIKESVSKAMQASGLPPEAIAGISLDSTSATVVAMDADGQHLRPAILWMDVRASAQATKLARTMDPALKYSGMGAVSAEWGLPKVMWLKDNEPDVWEKAAYVADCTDWLTKKLTGEWTMSINHAAGKYFYDRGWPTSLYEKADASDVLEKFPSRLLPVSDVVGGLSKQAAEELGLKEGTPVAEGIIDAYAGQVGLGVVAPGKLALITGSSHVMLAQSATPVYAPGLWGSYTDAVIEGEYTLEAGQASTGSVVSWFKNTLALKATQAAQANGTDVYDELNKLAEEVPIGSDGLILLDHFQGNRSPYVDPHSRGVFAGLTLGKTEGHLYRSIIEGICFGTENIFRLMRQYGFAPEEIVVSGGPVKSSLWMQMHADVCNLPLTITDVTEGPILGSAMIAAVGAGIYDSLPQAADEMVRVVRTIEPSQSAHDEYRFYLQKYIDSYPVMKGLLHDIALHEEQKA